jgi:diacylglycerol kinase (ATP)
VDSEQRDYLVVTNRAAGNTDEAMVDRVVELLAPADVTVRRPATPDDLDEILDERGDRAVVIVGGDGSLHTVVAALWRRAELGSTVVGLVPLGTGNDFARGNGLPLDVDDAVRVLRDADPLDVDLLVDGRDRVVVNAVHLGVGVEAAMKATPWKSRLGTAAFALGAILAGLRTSGVQMEVRVDGETVVNRSRRVLQAAVGNARTVGGGTPLFPDAAVDDGKLDVVISTATGRLARIGYAVLLKLGRHRDRGDVSHVRGHTATVRGDDLWYNADGELYGPVPEMSWRIEPGALRLLLPARARGASAELR